jgi:hypothetical protein
MRDFALTLAPGSEVSDLMPEQLGPNQFKNTKGLKIGDDGLFENFTPATPVYSHAQLYSYMAVIEITYDKTDERFLLVQSSDGLYRIDYDADDGNGYENEAPVAITLPTGISIPDGVTLKFAYLNGAVRIIGTVTTATDEETTLWYGYVAAKTLFVGAWEILARYDFETDIEGFTGVNCALSSEDITLAANGTNVMRASYVGTGLMKATKTISIAGHEDDSFRFMVYGHRTQYDDPAPAMRVNVLKASDSSVLATLDNPEPDNGKWYMFELTFDGSGETSVIIELIASMDVQTGTPVCDWDLLMLEVDSSISMSAGWKILVSAIEQPDDFVGYAAGSVPYIDGNVDNDENVLFVKTSLNFDQSQFSLLKPVKTTGITQITGIDSEIGSTKFPLCGMLSISKTTAEAIDRLTRLLICQAESPMGVGLKEDDLVWTVAADLDLTETLQPYVYAKKDFWYDPTPANARKLYFAHDKSSGNDDSVVGDAYFTEDQRITIGNYSNGESVSARVILVTADYVEISCPDLATIIDSGYNDSIVVSIDRDWMYDSGKYYLPMGFQAGAYINDFYQYSGIPAGTTTLTPKKQNIIYIGDRAFAISLETDDEGRIRYSPSLQFDSFPEGQTISINSGEIDTIQNIMAWNGKLLVFTLRTVSQFQLIGTSYQEDIKFFNQGLYSVNGCLVIDGLAYWLDKEECFVYDGGLPQPLMRSAGVAKIYRDNISAYSFIGYNKLDREIWFFHENTIQVYQIDKKNWTERPQLYGKWRAMLDNDTGLPVLDNETGLVVYTDEPNPIQVVSTFVDLDDHFNLVTADGIHTVSIDPTSLSEDVSFEFQTGVLNGFANSFEQKIKDVHVQCQTNVALFALIYEGNSVLCGRRIEANTKVETKKLWFGTFAKRPSIGIIPETAAPTNVIKIGNINVYGCAK